MPPTNGRSNDTAEIPEAKGDKLASFLIQFGPIVSIDSSDKSHFLFRDTKQGRNFKRVKNGANIYLVEWILRFLCIQKSNDWVKNGKGKRGLCIYIVANGFDQGDWKVLTDRRTGNSCLRSNGSTSRRAILYFYYSLQPRTQQPSTINRLRIPLADNVFQNYIQVLTSWIRHNSRKLFVLEHFKNLYYFKFKTCSYFRRWL